MATMRGGVAVSESTPKGSGVGVPVQFPEERGHVVLKTEIVAHDTLDRGNSGDIDDIEEGNYLRRLTIVGSLIMIGGGLIVADVVVGVLLNSVASALGAVCGGTVLLGPYCPDAPAPGIAPGEFLYAVYSAFG